MTHPDDVLYIHEPQEGRFVTGIPARDLTRADVERIGAGRMHAAVATGLYRKASASEKQEAAKEAAKAQPPKAEEGQQS